MNVHTSRDPLAGTRPAFLPDPDAPVDPVRRERDLRAVFDQPRPGAARPAFRRLPVMAAAVVVAAVVGGVVTAAQDTGPVESPRQVLLAVADAAARHPDRTTGRYWYVRQRQSGIQAMWPGPDNDAYQVTLESGSESWVSRTGEDDSVDVTSLDLVTRPLTERDRVEWDKAGNPVGIPDAEPAPGAAPAPPLPTSMPPTASWTTGPRAFWIGGVETSIAQALAWPTDGARLKELLLDRFHGSAPGEAVPAGETDWLMWETQLLLDGTVPTTAGTRAAAYQLLAELPGFRVMEDTGVPGTVGIARQIRSGWSYTVDNALLEWQVIIDPDTGALREWRLVLAEPGGEVRELPAGTVIHSQVIEQVGWVDTDPVVPPDADHFGLGE